MSPGQMLFGQMSLWQLESVLDVPRNLFLKFHQIRVSNSWDIADIEFAWVGWVGVACKVIFMSNPTQGMSGVVELWLSWSFDKIVQIFCIMRCRLASILQKGLSRSFSGTNFLAKTESNFHHNIHILQRESLVYSVLCFNIQAWLRQVLSLYFLLWSHLCGCWVLVSSVIPVTTGWSTVDPTMAGLNHDS